MIMHYDDSLHGQPSHVSSIVKGFLAGSLMVAGVLYPFSLLRVFIFLAGLAIFFDTMLPAGRGVFGMTAIIFTLFGISIGMALFLMKDPGVYPGVAALASAGVYYGRIKRHVQVRRSFLTYSRDL